MEWKEPTSNKFAGRLEREYIVGWYLFRSDNWEINQRKSKLIIGDGSKAAVNLLSDKYGEPYTDHDT